MRWTCGSQRSPVLYTYMHVVGVAQQKKNACRGWFVLRGRWTHRGTRADGQPDMHATHARAPCAAAVKRTVCRVRARPPPRYGRMQVIDCDCEAASGRALHTIWRRACQILHFLVVFFLKKCKAFPRRWACVGAKLSYWAIATRFMIWWLHWRLAIEQVC